MLNEMNPAVVDALAPLMMKRCRSDPVGVCTKTVSPDVTPVTAQSKDTVVVAVTAPPEIRMPQVPFLMKDIVAGTPEPPTVRVVALTPPEKVEVAVVEVAWNLSATTPLEPTTERAAYGVDVLIPTFE